MTVTGVVVNSRDVARSVAFYRGLLDLEVCEADERHAVLDAVTGTVEVVAVGDDAPESSWEPDDLQRGFRHIGFKVARVDAVADRVRTAGVPFHLEPLEATGEVRIAFFVDPDGTLVEVVERHLQYDPVVDIAYLADGGVVVEVFTFDAPTHPRATQVGVPGFAAALVAGTLPAGVRPAGAAPDGREVLVDPDGLMLVAAELR